MARSKKSKEEILLDNKNENEIRYYNEMAKELENETKIIKDSYENVNLGIGVDDVMQMGNFRESNREKTYSFVEINNITRSDPVYIKCLEFYASKLLNGINIKSSAIEQSRIAEILEFLEKLYPELYKMLYLGRSFGGSGAVMLFKNEFKNLKENLMLPLGQVKKGNFSGIKAFSKWYEMKIDSLELISPQNKLAQEDPSLIGTPLYYNIHFDDNPSQSYKVHRSRMLIFNNGIVTNLEYRANVFMGVSLYETIYNQLIRYHTTINALAKSIQIGTMRKFYSDVNTDNESNTEKSIAKFKYKLAAMKYSGFSNLLLLGGEDVLDIDQINLAHYDEVLNKMLLDIAGAAKVDINFLFEGVVEKDSSETAYIFIKNEQKRVIKPMYNRLIPIIYSSLYGEKCPEFTIVFNSLIDLSEKEKAEIVLNNGRLINETYKVGLMDKGIAIQALRELSTNPHDIFNNFTKEFIAKQGNKTYQEEQIEISYALNKSNDAIVKETNAGQNNDKKTDAKVNFKGGEKK